MLVGLGLCRDHSWLWGVEENGTETPLPPPPPPMKAWSVINSGFPEHLYLLGSLASCSLQILEVPS